MVNYVLSILATPAMAFTAEIGGDTPAWADPNAACFAAGMRAETLLNYLRIASILAPAVLLTILAITYIFIKARPGFFKILLLLLASLVGFFFLSLPNLLLALDHYPDYRGDCPHKR